MIDDGAYHVDSYERSQFMAEHDGAWVFGGANYGVLVRSGDGRYCAMMPYHEECLRETMIRQGIQRIEQHRQAA